MLIRDFIWRAATVLEEAGVVFGHGTDNALDEAVYLVYTRLGIAFDQSIEGQDRPLLPDELADLEGLLHLRITDRQPMAYLLGEAWFAGHRFVSDARALVPRSPIAELVQNRFETLLDRDPLRILDLCAGGGCIGIACALEFPEAEVVLADLSAEALALARQNIELHGVADRVTAVQSDLFASLSGRFDLIVSNPPYVAAADVDCLPAEYLREPRLGLLSADEGLALPLAILARAGQFLQPDGTLVMEVGLSASRLQRRVGDLPLLWIDFAYGGEGVCVLRAAQLRQFCTESY